jgi:hypothetical protein
MFPLTRRRGLKEKNQIEATTLGIENPRWRPGQCPLKLEDCLSNRCKIGAQRPDVKRFQN